VPYPFKILETLVVESAELYDNVWLDNPGRPATEQLKVTERFVRRDFRSPHQVDF